MEWRVGVKFNLNLYCFLCLKADFIGFGVVLKRYLLLFEAIMINGFIFLAITYVKQGGDVCPNRLQSYKEFQTHE